MTTPELRASLKYKRLRLVFEGRKKQLDEARKIQNPYCYGRAVIKYTAARIAWRTIRGWK